MKIAAQALAIITDSLLFRLRHFAGGALAGPLQLVGQIAAGLKAVPAASSRRPRQTGGEEIVALPRKMAGASEFVPVKASLERLRAAVEHCKVAIFLSVLRRRCLARVPGMRGSC
jgi:hypothetical protein